MDKELRDTGSREIDEATLMQFEKGYLWEVALSRAFGEKAADRPGEITLDGIIGSPDGIKDEYVEEYKCTAYSSKKSPVDMWQWLMQVKGYCKMAGKTKCIFRVLNLNGFERVYKPWELVFTQWEIEENWNSLLAMKKVMEKRGKT